MIINEQEKIKLQNLEKRIGIKFNNILMLKNALIHRSYLNESKEEGIENNERLEYLGDAVLELVVTQHLYFTYPDSPEGELTSFRAATVKTTSLAESASELGLGQYIFMSKGEDSTGGRSRPYILANTFEALIGAIYLDQGFDSAKSFLEKHLLTKIPVIVKNRLDIDNKSKLQELAQEMVNHTPVYEFIEAKGPDHDKVFKMAVMIGEFNFGFGTGKSKQDAEQNAASKALKDWDRLFNKYFVNKKS